MAEQAMSEALEGWNGPVMASHSDARAWLRATLSSRTGPFEQLVGVPSPQRRSAETMARQGGSMNEAQRMVRDFHENFGLPRNDSPAWPGTIAHRLRVNLIEEELAELRNAGETQDLVEIADALGDLLYVVYGAAVTYGIDLEPVFSEIHRSNMSKGDSNAAARCDGKVLKGANYSPPRVAEVLERQMTSLPEWVPVSAR
jgi:predicted HAD superfamily Cof-like phosphohydrolase